ATLFLTLLLQWHGDRLSGCVPSELEDPLLCLAQHLGALLDEGHSLFERLDRFLQRQVPRLEPADQFLKPLHHGLERPRVGSRVGRWERRSLAFHVVSSAASGRTPVTRASACAS